MRKRIAVISSLSLMGLLAGCSAVGDKAGNLSVVYGATTVLSLLLLIGCCSAVKKRDPWYLLLFSSVLVVNLGYFALAISRSLDEALLANRLAYFGSVFLPLSMWMIILNVTRIRFPKWVVGTLVALSILVFLIAASPGYLPIYYKEVTFQKINGVTVLDKVYGPLHVLYLVYLLAYFGAMVVTIIYATLKEKVQSTAYAAILAIAVFLNIGVWMIEQLVRIDFEILSVSYIISESFLLGLHFLETEKRTTTPAVAAPEPVAEETVKETVLPEQAAIFLEGLEKLTPKERALFDCYVAGMSTAQIMEQLNIKENTLKFHSKNLYGKLGISSRKQLMVLYKNI